MRQDFKDWLTFTGLLCLIGACVGTIGSAIWFDLKASTKCPAGSTYIQQHCIATIEPLP